ncbi:Uncharacterised protein [Achromobacter xylosoxidans]|nr:Uncharacterised protein [Achromobacter xylosoxidans]CUJ32396.1 Uncharacterised protein [Achromobacter xylosoxidans]CUJ68471.1 Uncharacterised protein [Achromobacter xylosoxidans]
MIRSRASRVRAGLPARIRTLLLRGSATTAMRCVGSLLWVSSSCEARMAMSDAMPERIGTTSVSIELGTSIRAITAAMRSRLSA